MQSPGSLKFSNRDRLMEANLSTSRVVPVEKQKSRWAYYTRKFLRSWQLYLLLALPLLWLAVFQYLPMYGA